MTAPRLAVFDCDGTLVDSQANICRAMGLAFAASGLVPPPDAAIRAIVGLSLVESMRVLAPALAPDVHECLARDYKTAFHDLRAQGGLGPEPLFDGIAATLDALTDTGWRLGVATGKSDRGLALLLDHHGLLDRFVTLQTADRHPSKPHPAMLLAALAEAETPPSRAVMIGDTGFDMAMAVAAGVHPVGVAWGYHPADAIAAAGAVTIAARAADLPALLDTLVPA